MISFTQAAILGLLQGISELFPISSLGHSVILPHLLGWNIQQNDPFFLTFLVATHLATAIVLFCFFWKDWMQILRGIGRSLRRRDIDDNPQGKLGWLLVVGTVPAGLLGLLFEDSLRAIFASAQSAALFLLLNGILLFGAEALRRRAAASQSISDGDLSLTRLSWGQAIIIGAAQAIALIPGLSRSGASMGGGLLVGLSHEDAARFSFLLATPIIGAAAVLKLPELFLPQNQPLLVPAIIGGLCAAITAYLSVRFLMQYFHTKTLTPFALYCSVAGLLISLYFLIA